MLLVREDSPRPIILMLPLAEPSVFVALFLGFISGKHGMEFRKEPRDICWLT